MSKPYSPQTLRRLLKGLTPWKLLANPLFVGLENIPETRPLLFVGNHTLYGMLDVPFLFAELFLQKNIFLRSLADHRHFLIPGWRDLLTRYGAVDGTRENCAKLMQAGECILVFPGGGREVAKRREEHYKLIWNNRSGFARLALEHQCTIVPFAAVGIEDAFEILWDANDWKQKTPLGNIVKALGIKEDILMPIALGSRGLLPIPERLYFAFGEPISPEGSHENQDDVRRLRDQTKDVIESNILLLQQLQKNDPERHLSSRLRTFLRSSSL